MLNTTCGHSIAPGCIPGCQRSSLWNLFNFRSNKKSQCKSNDAPSSPKQQSSSSKHHHHHHHHHHQQQQQQQQELAYAWCKGIKTEETGGKLGTLDYRMHFYSALDPSRRISPWHSISIFPGTCGACCKFDRRVVHMVCEMPRFTRHKMEISKTLPYNPIVQDQTKDKKTGRLTPRYIRYSPVLYNYGSIPQTWEDPNSSGGDNDPVDIIDLSDTPARRGEIKKVRVLGSLPLIDSGEMDWKVIGIDITAPEAKHLWSFDDVEKHKPGAIAKIKEWYRVYKTADGKPENKYAFDGKSINCEYTLRIIHESHESWKSLIAAKKGKAASSSLCDKSKKIIKNFFV